MIPKRIDADTENHHFLIDKRDGFHLVFVSREMKKVSPFHPHWVGTCGNEESLHAMTRWTAVRRDQWQEWGALAESIGQQAFAAHMRAMFDAEPLARVEGALIQRQDDPAQVGIGEMLYGPHGVRFEVLHVHTFQSAAACERFHSWFNSDCNHRLAEGLVSVAYTAGTDALSATLDEIAAKGPAPKRAPRGRRRGGGRGFPAGQRTRPLAEATA